MTTSFNINKFQSEVLEQQKSYREFFELVGVSEILLAHLSYSSSQFSVGVDIALYYLLIDTCPCTAFRRLYIERENT